MLNNEERNKEDTIPYTCKFCKKSYKFFAVYKNHLKKYHINELSDDESVFNRNFKKSDKETIKKKKCKICLNTNFDSEEDYLLHIKYKHDGKYVDYSICEDCGKQFRTKSELKHHIDSKCGTIKRYQCKICNIYLMTAGSLHNHMLRHTGEQSFMCRYCAKMFLTAGQLKVHERKHTQEKAFICNDCGKGFSYRQSLITHSTIHTGIKPYQCENCGNAFSCIGNLLKHRKWHVDTCGTVPLTTHRVNNPTTKLKVKVNTPSTSRLKKLTKEDKEINEKLKSLKTSTVRHQEQIKMIVEDTPSENFDNHGTAKEVELNGDSHVSIIEPQTDLVNVENKNTTRKITEYSGIEITNNKCKYCDKTVLNKRAMQRHQRRHEKSTNTFNCSCCKDCFSNKEDRKLHMEKNHANILTCQECDKLFSNRSSLKMHQKNTHDKMPRKTYVYICEKCGKEFKQKQTLQNHRESLCGTSLLYECNICRKKFTSTYTRNNHMKVHDVKKLLCKFCGKSFHWRGQLKVHERSHTGEKPYTCLYCPKAFAYRESLLTHSTLHTGIKPYVCESCGYSFSCISNLIKHKDSHANVCGPYNRVQM